MAITISPTGIASAEAIGSSTVALRTLDAFKQDLETDVNDTFFNQNEFGESFVYHKADGTDLNLRGYFDDNYIAVDPGSDAEVMSKQPKITIQESKFIGVLHDPDDTVTARNIVYRVVDVQQDGFGVVEIFLHNK